MRQIQVRPMVESGILSSVAIAFALIGLIFPFFHFFVSLIGPLPIIVVGMRNGYKWSIMTTVVVCVMISALINPLQGLKEVLGSGLIGIVLGYVFRMKFSMAKAILWGVIVSLVSTVAVITINFAIMGVNPFVLPSEFDENMNQVIEQSLAEQRENGVEEQQLDIMRASMQSVISFIKVTVPGGVIMGSVIAVLLQLFIAKKVLKRLGYNIVDLPPFRLWNLPDYIVYFFTLSLVMIYWGDSREIALLSQIGMNLRTITSSFLLVQGLALFSYFGDKYKLSGVHRGIILILAFLSNLLIVAGAIDMVMDYRRLRGPQSKD